MHKPSIKISFFKIYFFNFLYYDWVIVLGKTYHFAENHHFLQNTLLKLIWKRK